MTEAQLVQKRGEILGLKIIVVPPAWLKLFRNAATACVPQATEVAKISTNHRLRRCGANDPA
jgi:hypothetical protein